MKDLVKQTRLSFAYQQQAVKEAAEIYNALVEVGGRLPEVRRVVPYVAETTWRLDSLTALSTRFTSRRHVIELWPPSASDSLSGLPE
ncbi:hypothetical protein ODS41_06445 [Pyrobaculum sp. 3827-6]|uniref:hypothetical protein n=1 Tax=Pyrobaculum sp. 3827-6 TaxID=2983604 RepID=UPI0021D93BC9|nr:hypothetical protein [Pyrobaculum sp. 3827-6]MCU7787555.1 hypothetical protein [Pyrobaculum sp. 3827-6]